MSAATRREPDPGPPCDAADGHRQLLAEMLDTLVATAARAPSVHNTQPWRFRVSDGVLEMRADPSRRLDRVDPDGREMLISCGAALFGLRLAVRQSGYRPIVELLPTRAQPELLARVQLGAPAPLGSGEHTLQAALRRRHTHRGPFAAEPLPAGLLAAMQRDAEAEAATLVLIHEPGRYGQLAALLAAADRRQRQHPALIRELRAWTRQQASPARDGVPARAYPQRVHRPGALAQRDFDLGRGWGTLAAAGDVPAATAVLTTGGDTPADWLRAGQALHRLLLRAASEWVFASLHTQALELVPIRAAIRAQLRLPGAPQMLLQLGRARIAPLTPRRPVGELIGP
ncbi:MAG TPA: nitroreductase [Pilimelia sp.]|nr:nitroreductase [Pilimelia sp.]